MIHELRFTSILTGDQLTDVLRWLATEEQPRAVDVERGRMPLPRIHCVGGPLDGKQIEQRGWEFIWRTPVYPKTTSPAYPGDQAVCQLVETVEHLYRLVDRYGSDVYVWISPRQRAIERELGALYG